MSDTAQPIALVTGRFAEPALWQVAQEIEEAGTFQPHVVVLNIQVAALLTTDWVAKKLVLPEGVSPTRVILPGYCKGDPATLTEKFGIPFEKGPQNLHDLPTYLGMAQRSRAGYGEHNLEIIAEINDAAHLPLEKILQMADAYRTQGADVIDLGCDPQTDRDAWKGVGDTVKALRDSGHRVSIDSFHIGEIAASCEAGAELVLSVNSSNVDAAADWGAEVVVIPDTPQELGTLAKTIEKLQAGNVKFRIDPIIEPIGFGFAESLGRYLQVRRDYPDCAMMMGVGNLSEMTEVDSAGVNALLIGFCAEQSIGSVLTTQVINWARSSVAEIAVARQMMHYAVKQNVPPKHLDSKLVQLRDPKLRQADPEYLNELANSLTDDNVRIFINAISGQIHAMNNKVHAIDEDPFVVFDQFGINDASHAFYLGYEMAKAVIALTLSKNYVQDEPLRFGDLTREEVSHFERHKRLRKHKPKPKTDSSGDEDQK